MVAVTAPADAPPRASIVARRGLLLVAAATLVTGVFAGLARLGVIVAWGPRYAVDHGPLVVLGAFTTIVGLERAVALGSGWSFGAPVLGAAGAIASLAGLAAGAWTSTGATLLLVAVNVAIVRRQPAPSTWLMLLGSLLLAVGTIAWALRRSVSDVVTTWMGFFVLTIVAERLELSRLAPIPRWARRGLAVLAAALAAASIAVLFGAPVVRVFGALLAALGLWQLRFDLARRLLARAGLPRFAATAVLTAAGWLVVAGGLVALRGLPAAGPTYDAALHGVFVGYVLSMLFAHAPIVLPAVARVELPFTPALYASTGLLHAALLARVVGDLAGSALLRRLGASGNALALASFALTLVILRRTAMRTSREQTRAPRAA